MGWYGEQDPDENFVAKAWLSACESPEPAAICGSDMNIQMQRLEPQIVIVITSDDR